MIESCDIYIIGAWVAAVKAQDYQIINLPTEEPCAVISLGDQCVADGVWGIEEFPQVKPVSGWVVN